MAEEATSELLVAVEPMPANAGDGRELLPVIEQVEAQAGVRVERAIADGAYGSGDNRAECAERGIDLVSPLASPAEADVAKSAFTIDSSAKQVTCPQGQTTTTYTEMKDQQGRPVKTFTFERARCESCPLFARCVHSRKQGRSITLHYHVEDPAPFAGKTYCKRNGDANTQTGSKKSTSCDPRWNARLRN